MHGSINVKYYWLIVSTSEGHRQPKIYKKKKKKLKMLVYIVRKRQFYGIPFTFISSIYNYYQPLDALSVVSCVEILLFEYCDCISKNFVVDCQPLKTLKLLKLIFSNIQYNVFKDMLYSCVRRSTCIVCFLNGLYTQRDVLYQDFIYVEGSQ